jgi:uncharacterized protein (TIGR03000 family)
MLYRLLLMVAAVAIVAAVSPLAVRPAQGPSAGSYYYQTYQYGYNPGYYARHYPTLPVFVPSKTAPSFIPYVYYVPAPEAASPKSKSALAFEVRVLSAPMTPALADSSAQIELQVPTDAQVWFDGEKTTQTGTLRQFVSPPLTAGWQYTYVVRAEWKENGREVTESRRLTFPAGDRLSASFPDVANKTAGKGASASP